LTGGVFGVVLSLRVLRFFVARSVCHKEAQKAQDQSWKYSDQSGHRGELASEVDRRFWSMNILSPNQDTPANRRGRLQFVDLGRSNISLRCLRPAHSPVAEFFC
jgi:hypothetical protein